MTVRELAPHYAARALAGLEVLDPRGVMRPSDIDDLVQRGHCYEITGAASAVFVVNAHNGIAWVDALRGFGTGTVDVTQLLAELLEHQAAEVGLHAIAFQTSRPGLMRKALRLGYRVTKMLEHGWSMRKDLKCG